jgi:hypothetical protein
VNSSSDHTALLYLFDKDLLNGVYKNEPEFIKENNQFKVIINKFWNCFKEAIEINKCGLDGKQRILSVITETFGFREIRKKLQISFEYNVILFFFINKNKLTAISFRFLMI